MKPRQVGSKEVTDNAGSVEPRRGMRRLGSLIRVRPSYLLDTNFLGKRLDVSEDRISSKDMKVRKDGYTVSGSVLHIDDEPNPISALELSILGDAITPEELETRDALIQDLIPLWGGREKVVIGWSEIPTSCHLLGALQRLKDFLDRVPHSDVQLCRFKLVTWEEPMVRTEARYVFSHMDNSRPFMPPRPVQVLKHFEYIDGYITRSYYALRKPITLERVLRWVGGLFAGIAVVSTLVLGAWGLIALSKPPIVPPPNPAPLERAKLDEYIDPEKEICVLYHNGYTLYGKGTDVRSNTVLYTSNLSGKGNIIEETDGLGPYQYYILHTLADGRVIRYTPGEVGIVTSLLEQEHLALHKRYGDNIPSQDRLRERAEDYESIRDHEVVSSKMVTVDYSSSEALRCAERHFRIDNGDEQ